MLRVLMTVASLGLTIYALVDCLQTDAERVRYLPKLVWVVLLVLIPWVGPITWLAVGTGRGAPPAGKRRLRGPRGPEDDPDFLRNL